MKAALRAQTGDDVGATCARRWTRSTERVFESCWPGCRRTDVPSVMIARMGKANV
jgi:hypothetical protein